MRPILVLHFLHLPPRKSQEKIGINSSRLRRWPQCRQTERFPSFLPSERRRIRQAWQQAKEPRMAPKIAPKIRKIH